MARRGVLQEIKEYLRYIVLRRVFALKLILSIDF